MVRELQIIDCADCGAVTGARNYADLIILAHQSRWRRTLHATDSDAWLCPGCAANRDYAVKTKKETLPV